LIRDGKEYVPGQENGRDRCRLSLPLFFERIDCAIKRAGHAIGTNTTDRIVVAQRESRMKVQGSLEDAMHSFAPEMEEE
jgi:hypothetical protein